MIPTLTQPAGGGGQGSRIRIAKNWYLLIEDEELEAIEVESNHVIEIEFVVPRSQIDERFLCSGCRT